MEGKPFSEVNRMYDYPGAYLKSNKDLDLDGLTSVIQQRDLGQGEGEEHHDLFTSVREILIAGRILGVLPISGVFKHSHTKLGFRRKSLATITSLLITSILTMNLVLALLQWVRAKKSNALLIAQSIHRTAQQCWGWMIYISFLIRGDKFLSLFKTWSKASVKLLYSVEDKTLKRDCILICTLILLSCILENGVLHLEYFKELDYMSGLQNILFSFITGVEKKYKNVTSENQSWLETYYWRSNFHWAVSLGYNGFFAVIAFVQHKWMLYSWNYLDVILAVFGRALYFKFKMLYELSSQYLLMDPLENGVSSTELTISKKVMNKRAWMQVVDDFKTLYDLLQEVEDFFSPLVFGSYAVNIYYICIQLLIGLSPDITVTSLVQMIYGPWSFVHMAIRIYIVSLCLARINLYAHQLQKVFADCPIEIYKGEVISRIDKRITAGPSIGMTGIQCFTVSYPFLLSIVAVIFTFEIVLLQGTSNPSGPEGNETCCCTPKS